MHISPLAAYLPNLKQIQFNEKFYQAMRADFNGLLNRNVFIQNPSPGFYILEIKTKSSSSTGLVCLTSIEDYRSNRIKKHEQTIAQKEKTHKKLLKERKAMIKPAALIVEFNRKLYHILNRIKSKEKAIQVVHFPTKTTSHKLWLVDNENDIKNIKAIFNTSLQKAVIADGHHRFASLAGTTKGNAQILSVYFDPDQMQVSTFYRVIKPQQGLKIDSFIHKLKEIDIKTKKVDTVISRKNTGHFIYNQQLFQFKLIPDKTELFCHTFSRMITTQIFQINYEQNSHRIHYEEHDHFTISAISKKYPNHFIFILPSINAKQVLQSDQILPPKSTFFMPRIINGLIVAINDSK